jgi:Protein of unknown function (DUF3304)
MSTLIRLFLLTFLLLGAGCNAKDNNAIAIGIVGYNYTDRPIYSFSVNGNGGGNIYLSSLTSGGGGTVCCMSVRRNTPLPITMEVEWTWDRVEDENGKVLRAEEKRAVKAQLKGPIPENPTQFEVHIYPDGHAEVAVSDKYSPPRLKISSSKNGLRRE